MVGDPLGKMVGKRVRSEHTQKRAPTRCCANKQRRPNFPPPSAVSYAFLPATALIQQAVGPCLATNDRSVFHDEAYVAKRADVLQRVAGYRDEIGQQARRNASKLLFAVHDAGVHTRRRL